jgi:hypothetical protein
VVLGVVLVWICRELWSGLMLVEVWWSCPSLLVVVALVVGVSGPSLVGTWWCPVALVWGGGSCNLHNLLICLCGWTIQPYSALIYQTRASWVVNDHHVPPIVHLQF